MGKGSADRHDLKEVLDAMNSLLLYACRYLHIDCKCKKPFCVHTSSVLYKHSNGERASLALIGS